MCIVRLVSRLNSGGKSDASVDDSQEAAQPLVVIDERCSYCCSMHISATKQQISITVSLVRTGGHTQLLPCWPVVVVNSDFILHKQFMEIAFYHSGLVIWNTR